MSETISVVIPTIRPRVRLCMRALASVLGQKRLPDEIIVEMDDEGVGAPKTRNRGLRQASGDWIAFLDDDDELLPQHLERLEQYANETGADLVYPWFTVVGGTATDPFPQFFGKEWDNDKPHQTTISFLVRREAALAVGGFPDDFTWADDAWATGEDYQFVLRLREAGYKIVHLPERTWRWHWHYSNLQGGNTGGVPWRQRFAFEEKRAAEREAGTKK